MEENDENNLADLNVLIADKREKVEKYYQNEHTIKLTQLSSQDKEEEKSMAQKILLCTYEKNFQLLLLEELVNLNSWRDVEIITSLPLTYINSNSNNTQMDKNESILDVKWHKGL